MCLIALAVHQHPRYPLVLVTNRDEIHARPTEPMHWWNERPLLAGRDQQSGGTWLGIRPDGYLALVTNYRSGTKESGKHSRGLIPLELLANECPGPKALRQLHAQRHLYSGFNLITLGPGGDGYYCGSEDRVPYRSLNRGLYGLSNHLLQSDWPKVQRSRQEVHDTLASAGEHDTPALHDVLIAAFGDTRPAPDSQLPETGVGLELERLLSPIFISGDTYGTRATTVVSLDREGRLQVTEQQYRPQGRAGQRQHFEWSLA